MAEDVSFELLLTLVSCESAPALIVARGRENEKPHQRASEASENCRAAGAREPRCRQAAGPEGGDARSVSAGRSAGKLGETWKRGLPPPLVTTDEVFREETGPAARTPGPHNRPACWRNRISGTHTLAFGAGIAVRDALESLQAFAAEWTLHRCLYLTSVFEDDRRAFLR